jgi:hypothetical protein
VFRVAACNATLGTHSATAGTAPVVSATLGNIALRPYGEPLTDARCLGVVVVSGMSVVSVSSGGVQRYAWNPLGNVR